MTSRSVEKSKDESRDDKETDEDEEKDDGKKRDGSRENEGVGEKDVEMTEEEREEKERREKEERIAASIKKREAEVARELSGITNNNSYLVCIFFLFCSWGNKRWGPLKVAVSFKKKTFIGWDNDEKNVLLGDGSLICPPNNSNNSSKIECQ